MIAYNPKEWFTFIFRFHKGETFRLLVPSIIAICLYSALIAAVDSVWLHLDKESIASKISVMHSLLGFVISLLLVFRTNTAYERWWEGRKLWGGLVNCSRNLAIKTHSIVDVKHHDVLHKLICAFPFALKNHLRNVAAISETELAELLNEKHYAGIKHLPLKISSEFYHYLISLNKAGKINSEQMLILNNEVQQWMEICGACERIRNTPIPFSYSVFLKKFIFFYVMTLPIAYAPVLGFYSIPIVLFIFYVLASLELIAEEIEDPFGDDPNDLPLDTISKNIRKNVDTIFKEHSHPVLAES
ncbi:MAG: bestrophin family protein [Flavobacteriales bacterium]